MTLARVGINNSCKSQTSCCQEYWMKVHFVYSFVGHGSPDSLTSGHLFIILACLENDGTCGAGWRWSAQLSKGNRFIRWDVFGSTMWHARLKLTLLVPLQTDSLNDHFHHEKKMHFHTYLPLCLCEQPAWFWRTGCILRVVCLTVSCIPGPSKYHYPISVLIH